MKRFLLRFAATVVLTFPIGWVLGSLDWFWTLAKSPVGHQVLGWAAKPFEPFEPLDGENYDNPVVVVMLVFSFAIAAAVVWGSSALYRVKHRSN
ncbi:hypothetical protein C0Z18_06875 [Trinickia dabaoshanensis]|uniref:Uncharacterized protein n=1 Tax=Trinickia dabaoshanensis TaxID=564714 RepID=A0A2N7VWS9_9BURK|nr:hypothetical protein [Trinickia dabaoshanensis]PMS21583.1 hypothetical protein C0Z18_06875 [Trinickia dabaoshanensis]